MITLERLSPPLLATLKTIRLAALREAPYAFGSIFAEESQLLDEDWRKRLSSWSAEDSVCLLAMENEAPCGIIASNFDDDQRERSWVRSMWVAPTHRRGGLGARLLDAVESWARGKGVSQLHLMVTNTNAPAIALYERFGFTLTGMTEPYPNDPALFEYEMAKALSKP
jgi:GNAT superfamily N-acetyltransferase